MHDAEDGFAWAAKIIKFGHAVPRKAVPENARLDPGAYWIKSMCLWISISCLRLIWMQLFL